MISGSDINRVSSDDEKKFARGLCKIEIEIDKGVKKASGFLCGFQCRTKGYVMGMFTNNHVLDCEQKYTMTIENNLYTITDDHVLCFWTNKDIDVTFVTFKKDFAKQLRDNDGCHYFEVNDDEIAVGSSVTILQHPNAEDASVSRGKVIYWSKDTLHYTASTRSGSGGSPLLDTNYRVFGIHKAGKYFRKNGVDGPYNIGTPIKWAIEFMSKEICSRLGLSLVSMDFGAKHSVDWNIVKGWFDYNVRWSKMVSKADGDLSLDFPPLSLSLPGGSSTILVLFLKRVDTILRFYGGHYEDADDKTLPLPVSLKMTLILSTKNGEQSTRSIQQNVTMERKSDSGWSTLFEFNDIVWANLSSTTAPRAEFILQKV